MQVMKEATDCITKVRITDHEILSTSLDCKIRRYDIRAGELIEDFVGGEFHYNLSVYGYNEKIFSCLYFRQIL